MHTLTLDLPYQPPMPIAALLAFLGTRAVKGVEAIHEGVYWRTLRLPHGNGIVALGSNPDSSVPAVHRPSAAQLQRVARAVLFRLHSRPAMAANQTSTDSSTYTTSATRKKSATGSHWFSPGVRASTSRIENTPEATKASRPSHSHPRARARCAVSGSGSV